MQRKQLTCYNSKISPIQNCEFLQWWGLMIWIRKLKQAFPSSSGQVFPRLSSLLSVWTCGHGHECGTRSLCGAAVAKTMRLDPARDGYGASTWLWPTCMWKGAPPSRVLLGHLNVRHQ